MWFLKLWETSPVHSPFQFHFVPQVGEVETTLGTMYIGNYLISEIMGHSHICQKTLADLLMSFPKNAFFGDLNYLCTCSKI